MQTKSTIIALALVAATVWIHPRSVTADALAGIEPGPTIRILSSDSQEIRVAKAAMVVPHPRQLAWQQLEYTCFLHFGVNTFTGREWGNGMESAETFNPTAVDTDQWCRVAKEAGMKMMLVIMKHHDGFCLWQTRYNEAFSVRSSPWKNGQGDVLRQLAESCKKYDLKLGVYLSPADLYQIENENGNYGKGSKPQRSTIPTDPKSFYTNPQKGRTPPAGKPVFEFEVDDYNRYMLNQLYECLTEYGPIDEVWFDGAHPKPGIQQSYNEDLWFELIYALAPNAAIAVGGPDVRWCGNEHGGTRAAEWSALPLKGDPESRKTWNYVNGVNHRSQDQGGRSRLADAEFIRWWPSEVDTSIRHGWFWRDENQHVRPAEEIFDVYERSIGGNNLLLLNVPPNRDGRFADRDVKVLLEVGKRIRATYGQPAAKLTQQGEVYVFDQPTLINRCVVMEAIGTHGQRVEKHALDAWIDGAWMEIVSGETIGYKRILRFPDIKTDRIRLRILAQRLEAKISHVSVHYDRAPLKTPAVMRDRQGRVTIDGTGEIHYRIDGGAAQRYTGAFDLPQGGLVQAVATRDQETSETSSMRFDIAKAKWSIHAASSENPGSGEGADKAIDGDPDTIWHSKWSGGTDPLPHSMTIDFGESLNLLGFTYLPRRGSERGGILDQFRVEVSRDGSRWIEAAEGRFDNIANDPSQRDIRFAKPASGVRYLRFSGLHSIENKPHSSAAEIGVITR